MILLWGVRSDPPVAAVEAALARRGAAVLHLDQYRTHETAIELSLDASHVTGALTIGGERHALAAIAAIYVRPFASDAVVDAAADHALAGHADRLEAAMLAFLDVTPALLVNAPAAMATNGSKPYQTALIMREGFRIPDTLVTTDPAAVAGFRRRHAAIVYKSVSGERSIVSRLTDAHAERLPDIVWCPTQFQEHVPGRDIRVHVVGDRLFACEIAADADDYRYAHREVAITPVDLPDDIADRCRRLAAALMLPLAGIDLRRTPDGAWFCFEVNPSPAFTYYEVATGLPIAEAIAELLIADGAADR